MLQQNPQAIIKELNDLAVLQEDREAVPGLARIKEAIEELERIASTLTKDIDAKIQAKKQEIRTMVLAHRSTVKGATLMAVYGKPRVTWENAVLLKIAERNQAVADCKKSGAPSVSFRKIK